ncbi:hypothetical protein SUGI_0303210 [Cryptomeria japonica]|nr:hypothetical protein SUGI_0303210 [Cryptomeria japonica]
MLELSEKKGGVMQLEPSSFLFRDSISTLNLFDIKLGNGLFTWNNRRDHVAEWWSKGRLAFGTAIFTFAKQLQFVKFHLKWWNCQYFGNIFHAKIVVQSELNGITREIREHVLSEALLSDEDKAVKDLEEWELREEIY